jgi:hypothetical protein
VQPPPHAITLYLTPDDQIMVCYPDGQQIPIPASEPSRIISILRSQHAKTLKVDRMLAFRREFQVAFTHEDVIAKGKQVRAKHEDALTKTALRKEREKKQRLARVEKRDKVKAAEELLALVGL